MNVTRNPAGWPVAGSGLLLAHAFSFLVQKTSASLRMETDLRTLLAGLPVVQASGPAKPAITSLATDSRRVMPGALFFALPGLRTDGQNYVEEAIGRGAVAVVASRPARVPGHIAYITLAPDDLKPALAQVARRFYGQPEQVMDLVGVTGTNGKTTVAFLVRHLLGLDEGPVGLLGTVEYALGARTLPAYRTTPEAADLYAMLAQMRDAGCKRAVMEVSSHGIDQHRVHGLPFKVAVYTNLSQDHLDYHADLDSYFEVKARLFTGETGARPGTAVINLDDPHGAGLAARVPEGVELITYGEHPEAQLRATNVQLAAGGSRFELTWNGVTSMVDLELPGQYNVQNALAALGAVLALGVPLGVALERLRLFSGVPGRMERVDEGQEFAVLVDYAHTDDALRNALGMLRPITRGRLHCLFGCGGNRDRSKRPRMVQAVQELADIAWATADNPRRESLDQIFADMKGGVSDPASITFIPDRRRAISVALDACRPGDTLLIAGKGHETYQELADSVVPFDDRLVARELLRRKRSPGATHP